MTVLKVVHFRIGPKYRKGKVVIKRDILPDNDLLSASEGIADDTVNLVTLPAHEYPYK